MGRRSGRGRTRYVLYKGDEVLGVGTADQLADRLGVKADTIRWLASPANIRRDKGNRMTAWRV